MLHQPLQQLVLAALAVALAVAVAVAVTAGTTIPYYTLPLFPTISYNYALLYARASGQTCERASELESDQASKRTNEPTDDQTRRMHERTNQPIYPGIHESIYAYPDKSLFFWGVGIARSCGNVLGKLRQTTTYLCASNALIFTAMTPGRVASFAQHHA